MGMEPPHQPDQQAVSSIGMKPPHQLDQQAYMLQIVVHMGWSDLYTKITHACFASVQEVCVYIV
jgi:uncharacterized protein (DUF2132 family)